MARWVAVLAFAVGFVVISRAHAAGDALEVGVQYDAPAVCPSVSEFWNALQQRTRRVARAEANHAPILLRVNVQPSGGSIVGKLEIVRDGLVSEPRYVRATQCGDVLDALALTAALGIDPEALTEPPAEEPLPEPPPQDLRENYYDAPDPLPTTPLSWHSALGLHAVGALPVDLQTSWGVSAVWSLRSDGGPSWAPSVSVGATLLRSDLFDRSEDAAFGLYTAFVQACPLRLQAADWAVRPCGAIQGGVLTAAGRNISDPNSSRRRWLSLGIVLELEYSLSDRLRLQLVLAGHAPLVAQTYAIGESVTTPEPQETQRELARTPALAPWIGLGFVTLL